MLCDLFMNLKKHIKTFPLLLFSTNRTLCNMYYLFQKLSEEFHMFLLPSLTQNLFCTSAGFRQVAWKSSCWVCRCGVVIQARFAQRSWWGQFGGVAWWEDWHSGPYRIREILVVPSALPHGGAQPGSNLARWGRHQLGQAQWPAVRVIIVTVGLTHFYFVNQIHWHWKVWDKTSKFFVLFC